MSLAERKDGTPGLGEAMGAIGRGARAAARVLARAPSEQKDQALHGMAGALRDRVHEVLAANAADVREAKARGQSAAFIDRLTLDLERVEAMAAGLQAIAALPDPVRQVIAEWTRPSGLRICRVRVPIGVVGIIYESRPNVTADAGALCMKSGNAAILRSGADGLRSGAAIVDCLGAGLAAARLPASAIQIVPSADRAAVGMLLEGLDGSIDVIVPRGGKSLVERVQREARVPVFGHLEGICHVYVDRAADLEMAQRIVVNAKMRRTGICGAAEAVLVDRACAQTHLAPIVSALLAAGCEVRGDGPTLRAVPQVNPASESDWGKEFLDAICAVRVVDGLDGAMDHIARYGSQHTDAIVTDDAEAAERFCAEVDSAIVLHNASTQFADGGEFGMGAEIGIATGKLHARGPVGLEQLTTFKYIVRGSGQTRP